jgi:hypothetical protein
MPVFSYQATQEDIFSDKMSAQVIKEKIMGEVTGMLGVMLLNLGKETGVWQAMGQWDCCYGRQLCSEPRDGRSLI